MTVIHLHPSAFDSTERLLVEKDNLTASIFKWPTGVCGVRLSNGQGELVLLPFQGQQIWSAEMGGRNLTMKSMFDMPRGTREYLQNYGGFLLHCGFTAMGVPMPEDDHPVHGELPNAPYRTAYVELDHDEHGDYIGLGGQYNHTVAFSTNYMAEPLVKLYADSTRLRVIFKATNLKKTPMEFMYMAHVNWRPVDHSQLVYSASAANGDVKLRDSIPSHVTPTNEYLAFMDSLREDPAQHEVLDPALSFDPEIVFNIDYKADAKGWAHTMQVHPDGTADYLGHCPDQLNVGVRWICRTPDQDALGMVLPATAGPEGFSTEKAKGLVRELAGGERYICEMNIGVFTEDEAKQMNAHIEEINR